VSFAGCEEEVDFWVVDEVAGAGVDTVGAVGVAAAVVVSARRLLATDSHFETSTSPQTGSID
jgi:hypothetical protein